MYDTLWKKITLLLLVLMAHHIRNYIRNRIHTLCNRICIRKLRIQLAFLVMAFGLLACDYGPSLNLLFFTVWGICYIWPK